ncbi:MAG: methionyl-tRNA formyltransferase [Parcubacteria group bacterium LiPW_30]|nr:MAG: methionyl-tRNA formyltransferase [Parcubacteria group bacterium LiPW_30]
MKATNNIPFVFFGTPQFAVFVLEELLRKGLKPSLVVTAPDKPQGRGLLLTPPPVKVWAEENKIPFLQPAKLDTDFTNKLKTGSYKLFVVAAYGKIIPKEVLDIPPHGTLNVHPSLLPKYRGASPLQSQILKGEKEIGVTIMLIDEEMDHGPILESRKLKVESEKNASELGKDLAQLGGKLLSEVIPKWIAKEIKPKEQNHEEATFTKKVTKEDGLINLKNDDQYKNYLKYLALDPWPGVYFFALRREQKIRVAIKKAEFIDDKFVIKEVLPEGGKVMAFDDFLRGGVVIE